MIGKDEEEESALVVPDKGLLLRCRGDGNNAVYQ